jgi:hypothetical protein
MWFVAFPFGMWHNMSPGGATMGKWRIPDGNVSEWSVFMFGAPNVVAPACVDQGPRQLGPIDQEH